MRDLTIAVIRSVLQYAVAALVGWLVALGVTIDPELEIALFGALFGIVVGLVNWLGAKFPIINQILSLGMSSGVPAYQPKHAAS